MTTAFSAPAAAVAPAAYDGFDRMLLNGRWCPFGGEKNSGLGRFNGRWSIEEFTTVHWISVQHEPVPYPF